MKKAEINQLSCTWIFTIDEPYFSLYTSDPASKKQPKP